MIVHSFDRFGEVRRLDPATGALTPATTTSSTGTPSTVYGHYGVLGDSLVLFHRRGDALLLGIGTTLVPVDNTISISYNRVKNSRVLEVTDSATHTIACRLEYDLPEPIVAPEDDPTPFADPEDFDFGLFISNVANDAQRRSLIYRDNEKRVSAPGETE